MLQSLKKVFNSFWIPFRDIIHLRDEDGKGRTIILVTNILLAFYNVFITGVFYTGFLSIYGISITGTGILTFVPFLSNLLCIFSSAILGRFRRRKKIILTTKLFFYFCYIVVATTIPQIVTDPQARLIAFIVVIFLGQAVYAPFTPGITGWFYPFYPKDTERRARFLIYIQVFSSVFSCFILLFSSLLTDALAASPYQEAFIVGFRYFAFLLVVIEVYIQSLAKEPEYPRGNRMRVSDVLTVPFRHKKFMLCMIIMFVWNYITYLNSGLWQYHLLNHLEFPYTLLNSVTILYTVILLFTTPLWRKVLRRFSWVRTFGLTLLIWLPTEIFFFFFNRDMASLYIPVCAVQNFIAVGLNFAYANILYLNMPEDQSTTLTAFNIVGCNLFALLGTVSGTAISAISGDSTMSFLGLEIYSVQITVLVRAVLIAIMGFIAFRYWRIFSPEEEIARLDRSEEQKSRRRSRVK